MNYGFTGSRTGMTNSQKQTVKALLQADPVRELHHGDCVGADEQAHDIAVNLSIYAVVHPPSDDKYRAFTDGDLLLLPLPYLARNRVIVDSTHALIACPSSNTERVRSGTWSTVRYARKTGKPVFLIYPNGEME